MPFHFFCGRGLTTRNVNVPETIVIMLAFIRSTRLHSSISFQCIRKGH